uniref:Alpha 1,4-glycosyltransferase domain-containing protein n=1 Tax=Megaselia scalaris TaxID=36166 RepID=T1GEV0_MEGSC
MENEIKLENKTEKFNLRITEKVVLTSKEPSTTSIADCFRDKKLINGNAIRLEEILQSSRKPNKDKTIFFHVTNCLSDGFIELTSRQSCAIESAAMTNPSFDIFVLFASPTFYPEVIESPEILSLMNYTNIFFRNNNLWNYTKNTPAENWFQSEVIFKSHYVTAHISDLLRLLTLWHWGGIYMDLDVIVKESFEEVPLNFAGAESDDTVANGVMSFDSDGFGHYIVDTILKEFVRDFRGDAWSHNGPWRVTGVLVNKICKTNNTRFMTFEKCHGFQVFPTNIFYAVPYWNWNFFFEKAFLNKSMSLTKDSLLIHVWNKLSSKSKVKVGSEVAYGVYVKSFILEEPVT